MREKANVVNFGVLVRCLISGAILTLFWTGSWRTLFWTGGGGKKAPLVNSAIQCLITMKLGRNVV